MPHLNGSLSKYLPVSPPSFVTLFVAYIFNGLGVVQTLQPLPAERRRKSTAVVSSGDIIRSYRNFCLYDLPDD